MSDIFDFQAYIDAHRDPDDRGSLSFGTYAYRGDIKWLRTLDTVAPVRVMMSGTQRLWSGWGRSAVLKDSIKATEKDAPRIHTIARNVARDLHMAPLQVYITPHLREGPAHALGDRQETFVAVQTEAVRNLDDDTLTFVLGREFGHAQNGHVIYLTAAFYADEVAGSIVKYAIKPALISLNRWRQLSAFTADRAGLLCCQSLEVAVRQIVREGIAEQRLSEDIDVDEVISTALSGELDQSTFLGRVFDTEPQLRLRIRALELFTRSQLYHDQIGDAEEGELTLTAVDDAVYAMLRGEGGSQTQED